MEASSGGSPPLGAALVTGMNVNTYRTTCGLMGPKLCPASEGGTVASALCTVTPRVPRGVSAAATEHVRAQGRDCTCCS